MSKDSGEGGSNLQHECRVNSFHMQKRKNNCFKLKEF